VRDCQQDDVASDRQDFAEDDEDASRASLVREVGEEDGDDGRDGVGRDGVELSAGRGVAERLDDRGQETTWFSLVSTG